MGRVLRNANGHWMGYEGGGMGGLGKPDFSSTIAGSKGFTVLVCPYQSLSVGNNFSFTPDSGFYK
jgi:hypothetical protein